MTNLNLKDYQLIFNALENEKRIELYEFILQNIFVSKNDLTEKFSLNRANLNHHLEILIKAGIVFELELLLDSRRQTFLIPLMRIQTENLLLEDQTFKQLKIQINSWSKRNITVNNWKILRNDLKNMNINSEVVNSIESRLFPNLGKRVSKMTEYCYICRSSQVSCSCHNCKNIICSIHSRKIKMKNDKEVDFCLNCIEKYFG